MLTKLLLELFKFGFIMVSCIVETINMPTKITVLKGDVYYFFELCHNSWGYVVWGSVVLVISDNQRSIGSVFFIIIYNGISLFLNLRLLSLPLVVWFFVISCPLNSTKIYEEITKRFLLVFLGPNTVWYPRKPITYIIAWDSGRYNIL